MYSKKYEEQNFFDFCIKITCTPSHLPFSSLTVTPQTVLNSVPSSILRRSNLSQPLFSWALLQCFFDKNYTIRHVPVWEVSVIDLFSCPLFLLLGAANPSDYVANSVQLISDANNPYIATDSSLRTVLQKCPQTLSFSASMETS